MDDQYDDENDEWYDEDAPIWLPGILLALFVAFIVIVALYGGWLK